ncbi:superinfection immunity protein [Telluribacter sp. SYSU D00476]|uniref:superinfection immunity protein n=1 Tax=Telluribacter sp. SYSU D00476 TaxID=2811430 RepID=UPI0038F621DD
MEAIILLLVVMFFYFIPTIVASSNGKTNTTSIFLSNLFLGFTFIGWVVALIWATKKDNVL